MAVFYCLTIFVIQSIIYSLYLRVILVETEQFKKQADKIWQEDERLACFTQIANNPLIGDVIPKSGGFRKVRWTRQGMGKSEGVRLIYFNVLEDGQIIMTYFYAKNERENITPAEIKKQTQK